MTDIKEQLADAEKRQREVVAQINAIAEQRGLLLQEAFKIEGEIRILRRINGDEKG